MGKHPVCHFSGEVDAYGKAEDPGIWMEHFKKISRSNGWSSDDDLLTHAPAYLDGEAERWYFNNQDYFSRKEATWKEFHAAFIERFHLTDYDDELEERIRTPAQMEGEAIRAYA